MQKLLFTLAFFCFSNVALANYKVVSKGDGWYGIENAKGGSVPLDGKGSMITKNEKKAKRIAKRLNKKKNKNK